MSRSIHAESVLGEPGNGMDSLQRQKNYRRTHIASPTSTRKCNNNQVQGKLATPRHERQTAAFNQARAVHTFQEAAHKHPHKLTHRPRPTHSIYSKWLQNELQQKPTPTPPTTTTTTFHTLETDHRFLLDDLLLIFHGRPTSDLVRAYKPHVDGWEPCSLRDGLPPVSWVGSKLRRSCKICTRTQVLHTLSHQKPRNKNTAVYHDMI